MSNLVQLCNQYFGTKDFYEILKVDRTADEKEIKKAYHKVSLLVHPDRVDEDKKLEATEKFKILGKVHSILSDKSKRSIYDESGEFDEDDMAMLNWLDYWRSLFKKITVSDIEKYKHEYIGSETEVIDVKKAYVNSKGNMTSLHDNVPFADCDQEPRYLEIIQKLIDNDEVPEYTCFTKEPVAKRKRRRDIWERKRAEFDESVDVEELERQMAENASKRVDRMSKLCADIEAKYGGKKKRKSITNGSAESTPTRRTRSKK